MSSSTISRVRLGTDVFLYACHEADVARSRKDGSFNSHMRFEPFLMGTYVPPKKLNLKNFMAQVSAIIKHHATVWPQFRRNEDIDLETISYFSHAIATIFADLRQLISISTGFPIPKIPSEDLEFSGRYPVLQDLIARYGDYLQTDATDRNDFVPFEKVEGDSENESDPNILWALELWDLISMYVHEYFGEHSEAILSYASWKYRTPFQAPAIDWRVRPPVGDEFYKHLKSAHPLGRLSARRGEKGKGGDRPLKFPPPEAKKTFLKKAFTDGNSTNGELSHDEHSPEGVVSDSDPQTFSGKARPSESRGPKGGAHRPLSPQRDSHSRERRPERDRSDRAKHPESSDEVLEQSLQEVKKAMSLLKSDKALNEVPLTPTNSYLRRAQHAFAVESGFDSESRGEGRERLVYVKRRR